MGKNLKIFIALSLIGVWIGIFSFGFQNSTRATETQEEEAAPSHYDKLKDLDWLIGTWIDEDPNISIETKTNWVASKNYIHQYFSMKTENQEPMEGEQIIAWDPLHKEVRSWVFDSDGGLGEGKWVKKNNRWLVNMSYILPNGLKASSINIYTKIDDNSISWESVGRDVDGQILPNIEPVKIIRKTAQENSRRIDEK